MIWQNNKNIITHVLLRLSVLNLVKYINRFSLLGLIILLSYSSFSQEYDGDVIDLSVPEKVYLQLGSKVYANDQTIWFKAIVTEVENQIPTRFSGVLYVDLISPNGHIVEHKLVKLTQGIGSGFFDLHSSYVQGGYQIRAYTQWNRNFGDDFIFNTYVNIVNSFINNKIGSFALIEKEQGKFFLTGTFLPQVLGNKNKKNIKVYLDWGTGKDSLNFKNSENKDGYTIEYEVSEKLNWITLTMDNSFGVRHSETIVLNGSYIDIQFFPESGKMIHGFQNKIGFKAVGFNGKGTAVSGEVFDNQGNNVATFKSNLLGMGTFLLKADSTKTYHAKVLSLDSSLITYPLPKTISSGSMLSIVKTKSKAFIRVASNVLKSHVYIKVSSRGADYYLIEGALQNGYLTYELPSDKLPEGIIVFTLLDEYKIPVAERLYFNESKKSRLDIALKTDKVVYANREKTKLGIQVSGVSGVDMSVLVMNKEYWRGGLDENIRSYFLLSSELRGDVENPGYYLKNGNPNRLSDIDALLLTQGWRNYKYPIKRQGASFFSPQLGLMVKGMVKSGFPKKKPSKDVNLTMITHGKNSSFYTRVTDSMGNFRFLLDDNYGERMKIWLQAKNRTNKKSNYTVLLDIPSHPKVVYKQKPSILKLDTIVKAIVKAQKSRQKTEIRLDSLYGGVTQLDEVLVKGYKMTPEQKKINKKYGEPDVIITGDAIRKKEEKWSYGLFSILLFNYGDQIEIEQFPDGFMLAHINGGRDEPTLLMVDGHLLEKYNYEYVPNMPSEIIERIDLIKYAKFFKSRYLTVFPEADILKSPDVGHILSIYTKKGVGIHGASKPAPGTLNAVIDVFSPIKDFYAPKYNRLDSNNIQGLDLRSLIHWEPSIKTDKTGNTSVNFYNGDIEGDYIIIVEAISKDGRIGYKEQEYRIEK